jgi:TetR/AcrR family transcriptional regulator
VSGARLPAAERRAAVLDCACRVFSSGSYHGTTTAEIAKEAGVTEPILYRHFDSKRDLYLACIDEGWRRVREIWEAVIAAEEDPAEWLPAMGRAFFATRDDRSAIPGLWIQALTEASEDPVVRRHMRKMLRDSNRFVADVIRRAQEAGAIPRDRDAVAEAWIFVAIGVLGSIGLRLGGLVIEDLERIRSSRRRWMSGR